MKNKLLVTSILFLHVIGTYAQLSVPAPTFVRSYSPTWGAWIQDPLQTNGAGKVWVIPGYGYGNYNGFNGYGYPSSYNIVYEYLSMADLASNIVSQTYTLPFSIAGTGHVVYDGNLYFNKYGTNNIVKYNLATQTVLLDVPLPGAGFMNTYHYEWGGFSDIDFDVDGSGLWVMYSTAANAGKLVVSKLDPSTLATTATWNTNSEPKNQMGNAFILNGVVYCIDSFYPISQSINYTYNTNTSVGAPASIVWTNGSSYMTSCTFNPATGMLYSWNNGGLYTYKIAAGITIPPTITSFSPQSGPIGTSVTITGTNFNSIAANNIVYFGATRATVTAATSNQLTVTVPVGTSYDPISITNNGLTAFSSKPFDVTFNSSGAIDGTSFASRINFAAGTQPYGVAAADLDLDGKPDLAIPNTNGANTVSVLRNNNGVIGTINSSSMNSNVRFAAGNNVAKVELADIDGDGKKDIIETNYSDNTFSVLRNIATSGSIVATSFASRVTFPAGSNPLGAAVGDIDMDGRPDIITVNAGAPFGISVFRNNSTSGIISFQPKVDFALNGQAFYVKLRDIDGDGKPEMIAVVTSSGTLTVFRNASTVGTINTLSFTGPINFGTGFSPRDFDVVDLDGDNRADLVVPNQNNSNFYVFRNLSSPGSISLTSNLVIPTIANPLSAKAGDLDGDGKPDLVIVGSNTAQVFQNKSTNGAFSFGPGIPFALGNAADWSNLVDIDGDGKLEICANNFNDNTISILQNVIPTKQNQTITFNALPPKIYGDSPFQLTATSSSGLPINYTSSDPTVASISGNIVTILKPGSTIITASQSGDNNYFTAADVQQTLTINKATQTITFNGLPNPIYGSAPFALTASSSSGLSISYVSSDTTVAKLNGSIVTIMNAGITVITASQGGDSNYNPALPVSQTLTIAKANQTITANPPLPAHLVINSVYGGGGNSNATFTNDFVVLYNPDRNQAVNLTGWSLQYASATGVFQNGLMVPLAGSVLPDHYYLIKLASGGTIGAPLPSPDLSFLNLNMSSTSGKLALCNTTTVLASASPLQPTIIDFVGYGTGASSFEGSHPTASISNTTSIIRKAFFDTNDNGNDFAVVAPNPFNSSVKGSPAFPLGFFNLATIGDAPLQAYATSTSGLPVTYSSSDPSVATTTGSTITILNAGTAVITAHQDGNANFNEAADVQEPITINKKAQTISFSTFSPKTFSDAPFTLAATSSSGLPIGYSSSDTTTLKINGSVATILKAGTVVITASQGGDQFFAAATNTPRTLVINKASQAITFDSLASKTYRDAPFTLTATSSSGLPVSYVSSDTTVAIITGSTLTILKTGTTEITASQGGDGNYLAASSVQQTLTINKASQVINFNVLPVLTYGNAPFDVTIYSSSGLPLTLTVSDPSVASLTTSLKSKDFYTITIFSAGQTTITVSQPGDENYRPATDVSQVLTVNKANQTLSVSNNGLTNHLVISEIFGGGGFAGAPFANDYVELYNPTNLPVNVGGWSLQYSFLPGSPWLVVSLPNIQLSPGQFFLVQFGPTGPGNLLPHPDAVSPFDISEKAGKVALCSSFQALPPNLPGGVWPTIVDFVGYGPIDLFEGHGPAAFIGPFASLERKASSGSSVSSLQRGGSEFLSGNGYDSNDNANDFVVQNIPQPQNTIVNEHAASSNQNNHLVISEIFGGGGLGDPHFGRDYIELYNPTNGPVDVSNMSVQYAPTSSGSWVVIPLIQSRIPIINPGQYLLIGLTAGTLPVPSDLSVNLDISESSGKVALCAGTLPLSATSPFAQQAMKGPQVIDFVGYGTTDAFEGAGPTVSPSPNTSIERKAFASSTTITMQPAGVDWHRGNAFDSDNNNNDFVLRTTPEPQFSGSPAEAPGVTGWSIPPLTFGDPPFPLNVTSSSGLPVVYIIANPAVAMIVAPGNRVATMGAGTAGITAIQPGNINYNPVSVSTELLVNKGNQAITFDPLGPQTFGNVPFNLNARSTSGLPVSYTSSDTTVARVNGSSITILKAGTSLITASQSGSVNFLPAADVQQLLTVNKANQSIAFDSLSSKTYGDPPYNLTAAASSGLPVSFISSDTTVAKIIGSTVNVISAGTTEVTAMQAGDENFYLASQSRTLTIHRANQRLVFDSLITKKSSDVPFNLTGSASSGLPLVYISSDSTVARISGSTVTLVRPGTVLITAAQSGNIDFNPANAYCTLVVKNDSQFIAFDSLATMTFGDPQFTLIASATSGLPVSFTSSDPSVATVTGNAVTILSGGTTVITATQSGNNYYGAASDIARTLIVNPTTQSISFDSLMFKTYGDAPFNLTATASSGLPVTYTSSDPSIISINGNVVTILQAGTVLITAGQNGNRSYLPALNVQRSLTVNKAVQTIAFSPLPIKVVGDTPFSPANASSGLPVTYVSSDPTVATISNGMILVLTPGTANITASQSGNVNYLAVVSVQQLLTVVAPSYVINPKSGAIDQSITLTVTAQAQTGANVYTIDLSPASNFSSGVISMSGSRSQSFSGLSYNTTYYARVKTDLSTVYGKTTSFSTINQLSLTNVTSPKDGGKNVATSVAVSSNIVPGATNYTIELNTDMNFINGVSFTSSSTSNSIVFTGLTNNTTYYTRVQTDALPGQWGSSTSFTTAAQNKKNPKTVRDAAEEIPIALTDSPNVYPMPFRDKLMIQIPSEQTESIVIYLFDLNGKETARCKGETNTLIELGTSDLSPGLYILKSSTSRGPIVMKAMKE